MLRAVAQSAVRQGWRYADRKLFPPDGTEPIALPETPQWRAARRALTALRERGLETVRPDYGAPPAAQRPEAERVVHGPTGDFMERLATVRPDARGNGRWSLAEARQQVRDGYSVRVVSERTGWGPMWLADADRLATARETGKEDHG